MPPRRRPRCPDAASLGRPLTLKEKLAAARAGGAPAAAPAAAAGQESAAAAAPAAEAGEPAEAVKAVPPPAKPLGRPMTLQEKLAAARGGGRSPPRPARCPRPAKPAAAKPAAAKAEAAPRTCRRSEKITDPKDLAEAARQAAAKKAKELAAKAAARLPPRPRQARAGQAQTVPPRADPRARRGTAAAAAGTRQSPRLLRGQPLRLLGSPGSSGLVDLHRRPGRP